MNVPFSFNQLDFVPLDGFERQGANSLTTIRDAYDWVLEKWSEYPEYILWDIVIMPYKDDYNVLGVWLKPEYIKYVQGYSAFPNK